MPNRTIEMIISVLFIFFIGILIINLIPVLFSIFILFAFFYALLFLFRLLISLLNDREKPKFDENGCRIAKTSVIDIKDSDDSEDPK